VTAADRSAPRRRLLACVQAWPECEEGTYDPRCCRFPKSCSATVYDPAQVADDELEPAARPAPPVEPAPESEPRECPCRRELCAHCDKPSRCGDFLCAACADTAPSVEPSTDTAGVAPTKDTSSDGEEWVPAPALDAVTAALKEATTQIRARDAELAKLRADVEAACRRLYEIGCVEGGANAYDEHIDLTGQPPTLADCVEAAADRATTMTALARAIRDNLTKERNARAETEAAKDEEFRHLRYRLSLHCSPSCCPEGEPCHGPCCEEKP
jgi:hypothetical protein